MENKDARIGDSYLGVGGYTLTASMEEFMQKDPKAANAPLDIYTNTMKLVEGIATPATTTRWYIPGIYETALMVNTALQKPADFNNDKKDEGNNPLVPHNNKNVEYLNKILGSLTGADPLPTDKDAAIASASDVYMPLNQLMLADMGDGGMDCGDFWAYLLVTSVKTDGSPTAEEDKAWKGWLEDNAPDKVDTYMAYKTGDERKEAFLIIKGYQGKITKDQVAGTGFIVALSMFGTLMYANVSVQTGMLHNAEYFLSGDYHKDSGAKGIDNPKDYVRAVIAF